MNQSKKILVGASSCLIGQKVRFNGGHKKDNYIVKTLGAYFEFQSFCPEMAIGLGVPRPTIRLVRATEGANIRAVSSKLPALDHTDALHNYAESIIAQVAHLSGYILKKDSPSCGMERVKVYNLEKPKSPPDRDGSGILTRVIKQHLPELPMEEEGRLHDPILRENFIERVFVYQRWQSLKQTGLTAAKLVTFHTRHKYSIMAHDQTALKTLGQLVATAGSYDDFPSLCQDYIQQLMTTMTLRVSRGQHTNVLQHLMGYVSHHLDQDDRAELVGVISQYQQGFVPLIVPLTLLNHHFRRHPHPYIEQQYYLNPHPAELMLRNQL